MTLWTVSNVYLAAAEANRLGKHLILKSLHETLVNNAAPFS